MPPKSNPDPRSSDVLSDAEERLIFNAIRLDAAIRFRTQNPTQVDDETYTSWIDREIVRSFVRSLIYSLMSIAEGS